MKKRILTLVFVLAASLTLLAADNPPAQKEPPMATVGGVPLGRADVEPLVGPELRRLEDRRDELLSAALKRKIEDKLLDLEAAKQGISRDELVRREIDSKLVPPTQADIDAWFEANKERVKVPKEQITQQVRTQLTNERRTALQTALISRLSAKYGVSNEFEKQRSAERVRRGAELRSIVEGKGHPSVGPESAPVTIVEFSDFECPFCSKVLPTVDQVRKDYGSKVRLVFRQFPLPMHPNAQKAAEAALCAADQGKFWEMHDAMFKEQAALGVPALKDKAKALGLDAEKFDKCLDSGVKAAEIKADMDAGRKAGVSGTPAFFVNGMFLTGSRPYSDFKTLVDSALTPTLTR